MAAGIPPTLLLCHVKPARVLFQRAALVVCKLDAVAGVEIIPLEPDQCSDLRREALSVTLTFPPPLPGGGLVQKLLTFFFVL